jgi:hypothetical protein
MRSYDVCQITLSRSAKLEFLKHGWTCFPFPTERQCLQEAGSTMGHPPLSSPRSLAQLTAKDLRVLWPRWFESPPPVRFRRAVLVRALAYRMQERAHGGLSAATRTKLRALAEAVKIDSLREVVENPRPTPGTHMIREWGSEMHQVTVEVAGFVYRGQCYRSLSEIARRITGTRWSGPAFFGVKPPAMRSVSRREGQG